MVPVETALLFVNTPEMALAPMCETLNSRLAPLGITLEEFSPEIGVIASFRGAGLDLSVAFSTAPLPASAFRGAMEGPLSKPFAGILATTLARHASFVTIAVDKTDIDAGGPDWLTQLQVAHAATAVLAEWLMPAAVHWRQSNQLLTGAQYISIARETTPWALFAQARVSTVVKLDQSTPSHGLRLLEAADFIGRPIEFALCDQPLDEIHAASLSFLRHAVETGEPIPDGHTFGPRGGRRYRVTHVAPGLDLPRGKYELSAVARDADATPGGTARLPGVTQDAPPAIQSERDDMKETGQSVDMVKVAQPVSADDLQARKQAAFAPLEDPHDHRPDERARSMALSFLMLVIMPPVGAVLMLSNALFGSNTWRTGLVATATVALALAVGAYTFLNFSVEDAAAIAPAAIQSDILAK